MKKLQYVDQQMAFVPQQNEMDIKKGRFSAIHDQGFRANNRTENSTRPCGGENENSSGSSRMDQPNGFYRFTPPSTTLSTSNAIFRHAASSRRFEPRRSLSGSSVVSRSYVDKANFG